MLGTSSSFSRKNLICAHCGDNISPEEGLTLESDELESRRADLAECLNLPQVIVCIGCYEEETFYQDIEQQQEANNV